MYTVMRFEGDPDELVQIGQHLNDLIPNAYRGLDPVDRRFSWSICLEDGWEGHREGILRKIETVASVIEMAKEKRVSMILDIAIEPEDRHNLLYLYLPLDWEMIRVLKENEVLFAFTIYDSSK